MWDYTEYWVKFALQQGDVTTMSKDSKGDKSFPERLKRWFKIERGNAPGVRDIRLTEELRLELSSDSPAPVRLKAIRELTEVLASRRLEEVSRLCYVTGVICMDLVM